MRLAQTLAFAALLNLPVAAEADMGGFVGGSTGGVIPPEPLPPPAPPAAARSRPPAPRPAAPGFTPPFYSYPINTQPDGWAALKAAPDIGAIRLAKIPDGTLFLVIERVSGWVRVRLMSGETGWIAARLVGCCRPASH